ncbi:hypothetical protein [Streptomyces reniochalinae]|uniref:hypothetical protein n=1 Tax=Streptomyces reniochalinae TaxID=2250578 RepID=UPI0015F0A8EC|nr:hypothetical protein [Streptomyces reniochalinae]
MSTGAGAQRDEGAHEAARPATPGRRFGVALYVDFAATAEDWAAYRRGWCAPDGS